MFRGRESIGARLSAACAARHAMDAVWIALPGPFALFQFVERVLQQFYFTHMSIYTDHDSMTSDKVFATRHSVFGGLKSSDVSPHNSHFQYDVMRDDEVDVVVHDHIHDEVSVV